MSTSLSDRNDSLPLSGTLPLAPDTPLTAEQKDQILKEARDTKVAAKKQAEAVKAAKKSAELGVKTMTKAKGAASSGSASASTPKAKTKRALLSGLKSGALHKAVKMKMGMG